MLRSSSYKYRLLSPARIACIKSFGSMSAYIMHGVPSDVDNSIEENLHFLRL